MYKRSESPLLNLSLKIQSPPVSGSMRDILRFSSSAIAPARRFEAYRELYSHRSEILPGREAFEAEVVAWRLDGMLVFDRRLSGVVHTRQERVGADVEDINP